MHRSSPRNPRAEANPLRSLPLYRRACSVFGSTSRDKLVGNVRRAVQFRASWACNYAKACADLGKANRVPAENRRHAQREAMLANPDAVFLAHLATFEAAQAKIDALANRYPEDDDSIWELPEMSALWDQQREATNAMVVAGVTTWPARQRLAEVLRAMGHREREGDEANIACEDRMERLLLRSMFGAVGATA